MHTKYIFLSIITAIAAALTACDDIKPEDRLIDWPPVELNRVVLLEEFTGQECLNCPKAHAEIERLIAEFPDNLIAVSIHGGPQAQNPLPGLPNYGLATPEGHAYVQANAISAFPMGVVNRTSSPAVFSEWDNLIRNEISRPTQINLSVDATFNDDSSIITITTTASSAGGATDAMLQLWVVENGIVTYQKQPDGSMKYDYEHNHVFRAAVNGIDGTPVTIVHADDSEATTEATTFTHTIACDPIWKPENIHIIAFIYTSTSGVLQAAITHK